MPGFFDSVDAVFVINLDHRVDRWTAFRERWKGIIPEEKIIRSSAVSGVDLPGYGKYPWFTEMTGDRAKSWAGAAGCALSHKRVIYEAQKMGCTTIVVMEDDAVPSVAMSKFGYDEVLRSFLQREERWGLLYLGFNKMPKIGVPVLRGGMNHADTWRVSGVLAMHAYVVHRDAFTSLLRSLPEKDWIWEWIARYRAVDTWMREFFQGSSGLPVYVVLPRLVVQGGFSSDIATHHKVSNEKIAVYDRPRKVGRFVYFLCSCFRSPFSYLKNKLNSVRTYKRARKRGFPGLRNKT